MDGLTERQRELLEHFAGGCTYAQAAKKMYIKPQTVKMHARGIYTALDARDEAHAVGRGHEEGLLKPGVYQLDSSVFNLLTFPIVWGAAIGRPPKVTAAIMGISNWQLARRRQKLLSVLGTNLAGAVHIAYSMGVIP